MAIMDCKIGTRITFAGVRVLTLVPFKHDSNEVYKVVMDDVVEGVLHGFPSVDPFGREVLIFLDNVTCFADYLKVNVITDTMGHSAISFCTYCGIRRDNTSGGPCICFTSSVHSRRLSFQRLDKNI